VKRLHELYRSDAETTCELHDVDEADVSLPAFDTANIIAVQVGQFSQLLL
jgi:hypothetical protein